ncbi:hypothetical protein CDV55_104579 [Aspergillus turcosus]|uniref:Rhodopsin domain-containing protein n=1 Tax=Aspergillus turcosus TaxID=1245748 RepID=A0A229X4N3_9EURO|nr:hypothetical protein CDV55_104579 [Aspergillus turcosus]RLL96937.1 hypothetical protein CFD26_104441 [Aspergillus turcosus]
MRRTSQTSLGQHGGHPQDPDGLPSCLLQRHGHRELSYLFFYLRIFVTKGFRTAAWNVAFSTIGAFNLLTDVMIMVLPLHFIWKLQMSAGTKLALYVIFGLGFFLNACEPMLRPVFNAAFPKLFASDKAGYSTHPPTGASGSKNSAFGRMNDVDSEFQLTQLEERTGSREGRTGDGDEGSLDGRSQDWSTHVRV